MRTALVIGALLFAVSASAQDRAPKVWTDADLVKPLPQAQRKPDPAVLAAMKARADYIPLMGSRGAAAAIRASMAAPAAPAAASPVESFYARERASALREPIFYAAQPLYPFVSVVYSNGPYRPAYRRPAPCPVPPIFLNSRR